MNRSFHRFWKRNRFGFLFVAPLLCFLAIFSVMPFFYGIVMSFFDVSSSAMTWKFLGVQNYVEMFQDPVFWNSVKTMAILFLPKLLFNVFMPFLFAELIFALRKKKHQAIYRVLYLLPVVAPGVVGMLLWKFIYASDGLINSIVLLFNPNFQPIDFLNSDAKPWITIISLILLGFPFVGGTNVLIYLSGLMQIGDNVFEACRIDKCGTFRRIWKVDMPLCVGQFRYFLIFGIIGTLQDYSMQIVLWKNCPDYLYVPGFYLYQQAYTADRSGYAAAIGVFLFVVIALFTALGNFLTKERKRKKLGKEGA